MIRRLVSFLLIISTVILLLFNSASASGGGGISDEVFDKQNQYSDSVATFLSRFSEEDFGGLHYDGSILCINLIKGSSKSIKALSLIKSLNTTLQKNGMQSITYKYVKQSLGSLNRSVDSISQHLTKIGAIGAGVDVRNNCISVYYEKGKQVDTNFLNDIIYVNEDSVSLKETDRGASYTANPTNVRPATEGVVGGKNSVTMSWGAIYHGAPVYSTAPVGLQSFTIGLNQNGQWVPGVSASVAMLMSTVCARLSPTHLFLQEF